AYGAVLPRWLSRFPGWAESARRLGPVLGVLAAGLVGVILVQEFFLFEGHKTLAALLARMLKLAPPEGLPAAVSAAAPWAPWAIAVVAAALLALVAAGLCFAVIPGRDPLGLSLRGRTLYVYAAELLLVLTFVHFRITVPGVFRQGIFIHYWPF